MAALWGWARRKNPMFPPVSTWPLHRLICFVRGAIPQSSYLPPLFGPVLFSLLCSFATRAAPGSRRRSPPANASEFEDCKVDKVDYKAEPQIYETTDFCDHRGMQVVFLGTSSSIPTRSRNTSCLALRLDGTVFLFDCGEGAQKQLNESCFRQIAIDNIFITHMHGDHIFGLPGILSGLSTAGSFKQKPINIYGPPGLRLWIRATLTSCYGRVLPMYAVHELILHEEVLQKAAKWEATDGGHQDELPGENIYCTEDGLWPVLNDNKYSVKAGFLHHSIPCWGYVVEEHARPGRFSVERAAKAGLKPGHQYSILQQGHTVTLNNGKMVHPSDVLGPPRRGRKVVILGDTSDSSSLQLAAKGADLLVHECTILEQDAEVAAKKEHSTATMAGQFARAIDARFLVLTHFSCKYEGRNDRLEVSVKAAKTAFGKNTVIAARDLLAVTVCQSDEPALTSNQ
eukprot:c21048_g1_i1 orf=70-1437(+)